jgi:acetyl esterase/lipase
LDGSLSTNIWAVRRRFVTSFACLAALVGLAGCANAGSSPTANSNSSPDAGTGPVPTLSAGQKVTVTYCNHEQARITEPATLRGRAPAAVYVHGGSWVSGDFDTGGFIVNQIGSALSAQGFVVVSVNYRLGPNGPWPAQIEDVKCAIRYLRANAAALHVDPAAIGAWGQSAGGHLVGLLGTASPAAGWDVGAYSNESSRVEAVVDMAGPSDLVTMGDQGDSGLVQDSFISLLGAVAPTHLGAALKAASPVTYIAKGDPPFLILHSDNDRIVYPQQSEELSWDLSANAVPNQLVIVKGAGHEFNQGGGSPDPTRITEMVVSFMVQNLHPRS